MKTIALKKEGATMEVALALSQDDRHEEALRVVQELLLAAPGDKDILLLAMKLNTSLKRFCDAAEIAADIAELDEQNATDILIRAFDLRLRCGDFDAAERHLTEALELSPSNVTVRRLLAQLFNAQGRRFEASEHVRELIRLRVVQPNEILSLIDLSGPFFLVSFDEFVDSSQVSLFMLGDIRNRYVALHESHQSTLNRMQQLSEKYPDSTATAAFRGRVLAESARLDELIAWHLQLPAGIERQPEYWRACGEWMLLEDRYPEAIRAFAEALRRDPTDRGSLRSMIRSFDLLEKEGEASELRERLAILDQIFRIAKDASPEQSEWISNQYNKLARPWESAAWLMHAAKLSGRLPELVPALNKRHATVIAWEQGATSEQIREAMLKQLLGFDATKWPLPNLESSSVRRQLPSLAKTYSELRFKDVASQVGITTRFRSGFQPDEEKFYIYQVNGGGLASLDFDLDGRCDIYVVQAGGKPNDPIGSTANQLFRQQSDGRFSDVTAQTGTGDRSYGQGVCAGDVNQDGHIDLLVANVGVNVLFVNQGDGTFKQRNDLMSNPVENWTSSIGLGDLTGDHLPEIIEINYICDSKAYHELCKDHCHPQRFHACVNHVYRGNSDGTFSPWRAFEKVNNLPNYGFGLVLANFDNRDGNDFFVSNDGDLNHFWTSTKATDISEGKFEVVESAGIRGCSVGRGGSSQACMGIASGDFNRDGTLDLHVTNFFHEPVNLFIQNRMGFFSDEAMRYRLFDPSFEVLGFGTQSGDFDNDGWLDLAVLNGHVYKSHDPGIPFRMLPQLFVGNAEGFSLQDQALAGEYWQKPKLGRTLAMLDWNRDGRVDLVGNHLDEPIALLQNESPSQSWLQLELVGVTSERDAIGAEVRVKAGDAQLTGWQIGGDGYMCTNEPIVHFGLGNCQLVESIEIRWPSGQIQLFNNVRTDCRLLVVEGESEPFTR